MCTVSFVPLSENNFILTSNRDESTARGLASLPKTKNSGDQQIILPVDPLGKGSWVALSSKGWMCCLLNGAFEKHKHRPPYRNSRGWVVLDFFSYEDPKRFIEQYNLEGMEPFTLVMTGIHAKRKLFELRWDGMKKYMQQLSADEFHLWSSATLYPAAVHAEKEKIFSAKLKNLASRSPDELIGIHSEFKYEDWMKGDARVMQVSTLSTTSVLATPSFFEMHYKDRTFSGEHKTSVVKCILS